MSPTEQALVLLVLAAVSGWFLRRVFAATLRDPSRIAETRWTWPESVFIGFIVGFFLLMAISAASRPVVRVDLSSVVASMALYGAIVVFVVGFLVVRNIRPVQAFGLRWSGFAREWWFVPVALLLAYPYIFLAQWAAYSIVGPDTAPQPIVTFLLESQSWTSRLAVAAIAVLIAPVTEELIFRGCLYGMCRQFAGRIPALVFSAVVFAVIHGHPASLPGLFLLSVALTLLYERTGSLWAPIALHALFNGITVLVAVFWPGFLQ